MQNPSENISRRPPIPHGTGGRYASMVARHQAAPAPQIPQPHVMPQQYGSPNMGVIGQQQQNGHANGVIGQQHGGYVQQQHHLNSGMPQQPQMGRGQVNMGRGQSAPMQQPMGNMAQQPHHQNVNTNPLPMSQMMQQGAIPTRGPQPQMGRGIIHQPSNVQQPQSNQSMQPNMAAHQQGAVGMQQRHQMPMNTQQAPQNNNMQQGGVAPQQPQMNQPHNGMNSAPHQMQPRNPQMQPTNPQMGAPQPRHPQQMGGMMQHPQHGVPPQRMQPQRPPQRRKPGFLMSMPQEKGPDGKILPDVWKLCRCIEVNSGDWIRVKETARKDEEGGNRELIIDTILAPKTARNKYADEEAFGWEAKEFLRSHLVRTPKPWLAFKMGQELPSNSSQAGLAKRYFAEIVILDPKGVRADNIDLAELMVGNGYAKAKQLRRDRFQKFDSQTEAPAEDKVMSSTDEQILNELHRGDHAKAAIDIKYKRLKTLENEAREKKVGRYSADLTDDGVMQAMTRDVEFITNRIQDTETAKAFFSMAKGHTLDAIVCTVREGTVLNLEILPGNKIADKKHRRINVNVLGVAAPSVPLDYAVALRNWNQRGGTGEKPKEAAHRPEPFGLDAREHTEMRLLNQRVQVELKWCSSRGNVYGRIILVVNGQERDIAPSLVHKGFAAVIGWHASHLPDQGALLLAKQKEAVAAKSGIWSFSDEERAERFPSLRGALTPKPDGMKGRLLGVLYGDCVQVLIDGEKEPQKFYLAGIRSFREGYGPNDPVPTAPVKTKRDQKLKYINASREFLRKATVGKNVLIENEYIRELPPRGAPVAPTNGVATKGIERQYVTLWTVNRSGLKERNLVKELVENGLASAMDYAQRENKRSMYTTQLQDAYTKAKEAQKGWHNPNFRQDKMMDLSITQGEHADFCSNVRRAIWGIFESKKKSYVNGVVEFVFGGHKVKVVIDTSQLKVDPRLRRLFEGAKYVALSIFLEGIECTRARRGGKNEIIDQENERCSDAAKAFVEQMVNQQEVRLRFQVTDKKYNYLGNLLVSKAQLQSARPLKGEAELKLGQNKTMGLAKILLRRGLAKTRKPLNSRTTDAEELLECEKMAQAEKSGYWRFTDFEKEQDKSQQMRQKQDAQTAEAPPAEDEPYYVTHVENGSELYAMSVAAKDNVIPKIEAALAGYPAAAPRRRDPWPGTGRGSFTMKDTVAGRYDCDNQYYRCKIEMVNASKVDGQPNTYLVRFLDYGNVSELKYEDLEFLPPSITPEKVKPLAQKLRLAFLQAPPKDYQNVWLEAGRALNNLVLERAFKVRYLPAPYANDVQNHVVLMNGTQMVNAMMVAHGLCRISGTVMNNRRRLKPVTETYIKKILDTERDARRNRKGMFMHGDVDGESDQDD